ncbi:MAG TPA: hypothetical protein VNF99_15260 [Stellaceae bacterium]|nr:hypothetical protein [Stellaceae bacterium]
MLHIKLPNGSSCNPAEIDRFVIEKHFMSKKYYVALIQKSSHKIDIQTNLTLTEAESLKRDYVAKLEEHRADIPPYDEGKEAGLVEGKKRGHKDGYEKGYSAGSQAAYDQGRQEGHQAGYNAGHAQGLEQGRTQAEMDAERRGADRVLEYLAQRRHEMLDEMKYQEHLVESRRQSLRDMITLVESVIEIFRPKPESL